MIRSYQGGLGSGKTHEMVADARTWLKHNKGQIYTNMAGLKCPEAIFIGNLSELLYCRSGLLLLDEGGVVVSSRFFHETSRDILTRFAQLRKHGLDLYYTTQHQDRVDKVLREITSEEVHMVRMLGQGFMRRLYLPGQKDPSSSRPRRYDPTVFALYDTYEIIEKDGSSVGRADAAAALSTVARRSQTEDDARKAAAALQAEIPARVWADKTIVYTKEAAKALLWLKERGFYRPDQDLRQQLQTELRRRRWLSCWHLRPDDAPPYCTPDAPWLDGYDPVSVMLRLEKRELELAEEVIKMQEREKALRSLARSDAKTHLLTRSFSTE